MLFSSPRQLQQPSYSDLIAGTSPNTIVWNNKIHLFYTGPGEESYGIWHTTSEDGELWSQFQSIQLELIRRSRMSVMPGTSPCAASQSPPQAQVLQPLYLFYTGTGKSGICYTKATDGTTWYNVESVGDAIRKQHPKNTQMNVMEGTSPSAVFWMDRLYLFYTSAKTREICYTSTTDFVAWSRIQSIIQLAGHSTTSSEFDAVMKGTSPQAVVWKNQLYLFYTGESDGIWYTKTTNGQSWDEHKSIEARGSSLNVQTGSSANALVFLDDILYVFYVSGNADGLWFTQTDNGLDWSEAFPVDTTSGGQRGPDGTSPWAFEYKNSMFVFWFGSLPPGSGVWVYQMTVEVGVSLDFTERKVAWKWLSNNSPLHPSIGALVLNDLGTRNEFVFNLQNAAPSAFISVDLALCFDNESKGQTKTVRIPQESTVALSLYLVQDSVEVDVRGENDKIILMVNNREKLGTGYYVSVRISVLVDNIRYTSPDPQIVLQPMTPPTDPLSLSEEQPQQRPWLLKAS